MGSSFLSSTCREVCPCGLSLLRGGRPGGWAQPGAALLTAQTLVRGLVDVSTHCFPSSKASLFWARMRSQQKETGKRGTCSLHSISAVRLSLSLQERTAVFREFAQAGPGVLFCTVRIICTPVKRSISAIGGCSFSLSTICLAAAPQTAGTPGLLVWLGPWPLWFVT